MIRIINPDWLGENCWKSWYNILIRKWEYGNEIRPKHEKYSICILYHVNLRLSNFYDFTDAPLWKKAILWTLDQHESSITSFLHTKIDIFLTNRLSVSPLCVSLSHISNERERRKHVTISDNGRPIAVSCHVLWVIAKGYIFFFIRIWKVCPETVNIFRREQE